MKIVTQISLLLASFPGHVKIKSGLGMIESCEHLSSKRDHSVTELCILFQLPYPRTPSHSYRLPLLSHRCYLDQTVWCQLPTSPALWPTRAPSSGCGPSHLAPRCGSLMGQEPALCRYLRSLLPMQGSTHAQPPSMDGLLITPLLFNSIVSDTHHYILENAMHCGASLSERLKSVVGFLQLLKTVLFL